MNAQRLGAAAAGGMLDPGCVEQALIEQPGGERIGLAAGKLQGIRERMARDATCPERRLEQRQLIRTQSVPGGCDLEPPALPRSTLSRSLA